MRLGHVILRWTRRLWSMWTTLQIIVGKSENIVLDIQYHNQCTYDVSMDRKLTLGNMIRTSHNLQAWIYGWKICWMWELWRFVPHNTCFKKFNKQKMTNLNIKCAKSMQQAKVETTVKCKNWKSHELHQIPNMVATHPKPIPFVQDEYSYNNMPLSAKQTRHEKQKSKAKRLGHYA